MTVASYPAITRIYGPEAFGILGVFLSVVSVLTPIAGFTFPLAIALPKSDCDAMGLVRLSLLAGAMAALVTLLMLLFAGEPLGRLLGFDQVPGLVAILPATVLVLTAQQAAQQWAIRTKQFALTSKITVSQSLLVNLSKVSAGLLYPYAVTLVVVTVAGLASHAAALWLSVRRRTPEDLDTGSTVTPLSELVSRYRDFPIYRAPQDLVNAISQGLPIIALSTFYGPAVAGFFLLARSVLGAPLELIGNSIGTVLYPRWPKLRIAAKAVAISGAANGELLALGAIPFGVIFAVGPIMFELFFGSEWREAGEYARWMTLWIMLAFANVPSVRVIPVIHAQKMHLIFGVIMVGVRFGAVAMGYLVFRSAIYSVLLYSIAGMILNTLLIVYVLRRVRQFDLRELAAENVPLTS